MQAGHTWHWELVCQALVRASAKSCIDLAASNPAAGDPCSLERGKGSACTSGAKLHVKECMFSSLELE